MDPFFRHVDKITKHAAFAIFATLLSLTADIIAVAVLLGLDPTKQVERYRWTIFLITALSITGIIIVLIVSAIVRVYLENKALRRTFAKIHSIQHFYRDKMCDLSHGKMQQETLLSEEHNVLTQICRELADIFWDLIGRECHACTTLVSKSPNGDTHETFVWASSQLHHISIAGRPQELVIEENTRFSEALKSRPGKEPQHYYCPDLCALPKGDYKDSFVGWEHHYRSCIVVPIRVRTHAELPQRIAETGGLKGSETRKPPMYTPPDEVVGFQKIETLFTHRLNDTYHVEIVAAVADLMASFMALRLHWLAPPNSEPGSGT